MTLSRDGRYVVSPITIGGAFYLSTVYNDVVIGGREVATVPNTPLGVALAAAAVAHDADVQAAAETFTVEEAARLRAHGLHLLTSEPGEQRLSDAPDGDGSWMARVSYPDFSGYRTLSVARVARSTSWDPAGDGVDTEATVLVRSDDLLGGFVEPLAAWAKRVLR